MTSDEEKRESAWQEALYENVWLWAFVAVLFWFLSYVVWGFVDLMLISGG